MLTLSLYKPFQYANQTPCDNNPQNVNALVPDTDHYYFLSPRPFKKTLQYFLNLLKSKPLLEETNLEVFTLKKSSFLGSCFFYQTFV